MKTVPDLRPGDIIELRMVKISHLWCGAWSIPNWTIIDT